MNAKDVANKIKIASKKILNTKKGRIGLIVTICCATAITAVSMSAVGSLRKDSNIAKPKTQSTSSIPTVIEKVQPVSDEDSVSSTVASTVSVASSHRKAEENSNPASSSTPAPKSSTNHSAQSSQTHYVVVEPASSREKTTASSSNTSSHVANYQGTNVTKTYTDEITGSRESVQFLGVGAGYREVAIAQIQFQTSADMGAAHSGDGTATLTGPTSHTANAMVGATGTCDLFIVGNLTAGTYEVKLTANDGTDVVRFHITVDTGGIVQ